MTERQLEDARAIPSSEAASSARDRSGGRYYDYVASRICAETLAQALAGRSRTQ